MRDSCRRVSPAYRFAHAGYGPLYDADAAAGLKLSDTPLMQ